MQSLVDFKVEKNHIAIVTLNRPEAANALSIAMLDQLNKVIEQIHNNKAIYCTIITGASNKVFCAGADLKERKGMSEEEVIDTVSYIGNTISNIENLNMPVIAALNGVAFGGGLELALACDFRYVAKHASMGLTEASLAIIPGAGGTQRLTRLIGIGQAKRLIFTAERISAKEALSIRLVEKVFPGETLLDETIKTAAKIAENGPIALEQAKLAIRKGIDVSLRDGLALEHQCYKETLYTKDRLEGLQAFAEKRKPIYKRT